MKKTVLIIEDSKTDLTLLSEYLKDEYNVIEASSGQDGISIIENEFKTISAVFLDLIMPAVDGFEVLRKLKENPALRHIPIIVTTSLTDEESQQKALELGATIYLTKPYNKAILTRILKNIISLCEMSALTIASLKDNLTDLYNRDAFFSEASNLIKNHKSGYYYLSYANIEHFKVINEQYGHKLGNDILIHIGKCINELIENISGIASRVTGDNFAILFPATYIDSDVIRVFHQKITTIDFLKQPITVRVGRYHVKEKSLPVDTMYDRAIIAESSIQGKYGLYVAEYDASMKDSLLHEQQIINAMEQALKNKEFEAWYQPQFNHATGCLIGAEALARWKATKDGDIISPDMFIPIFEKNGFVYELDKYIWEEVCQELRKLLNKASKNENVLPISVNISRNDLFHEDFKDIIIGLVEKYKLPIELLRLEITESAFSDAADEIVSAVKALIDYGFTVEIDDFGSGYSSLNTLKDVPAQILKLDMKFFESTSNVERGGNIVESVVRMAKWIGMAVIAEGVEIQEQADYLKSIGCYYIQGYFYAKPMPCSEYEELLAKENKETELNRLITVKELDNNRFWDPKSMDTLIFNSYIGGACIFEYNNGKIELLRANEKYIKGLGKFAKHNTTFSKLGIENFLLDKDKELLNELIQYSIITKVELCAELKLIDAEKALNPEYVRVTARVIATAGERYLFYCVLENCTDKKLIELKQEELKKKEKEVYKQLQAIVNNSPCGITAIVMNPDQTTEYVFVNEKFCELLGYTKVQFYKEISNGFDLIVPEDRKVLFPQICELTEVGQSLKVEMRAKRRDGSSIYVRGNIIVIKLANVSKPVQLSTFVDVSVEKEAELRLKRLLDSRHNIEALTLAVSAIMKNSPDMTYIKDNELRYLAASPAAYALVNCKSEEEMIGKTDIELFPRELGEKYNQDDSKIIKTKEAAINTKDIIITADGEVHSVLSSKFPILNTSEEVIGLYGISRDITKIENDESKLKILLNTIPDGLVSLEYNENKFTTLYINDEFFKDAGYSRKEYSELSKEDPFVLIHEDDKGKIIEFIESHLETIDANDVLRHEFRCKLKQGVYRWYSIRCSIEYISKRHFKLNAVLINIDDLKNAEEQIL